MMIESAGGNLDCSFCDLSLMVEDRNKYMGFDPVKWVERLIDVNSGSQFSETAKKIISNDLEALLIKLEVLPHGTGDNEGTL